LEAKDRDLARGFDKDGNVHPLSPKTIKYRKSAVGPVTRRAPRLIPALALSRVRSLLTGRAHTTCAEFWWKYDPVTAASFAEVLHFAAAAGHDVFGLSPEETAWVKQEATKKWRAWKAAGGGMRATAEAPGVKASRKPGGKSVSVRGGKSVSVRITKRQLYELLRKSGPELAGWRDNPPRPP